MATLGDVLQSAMSRTPAPEQEWVGLVWAVAAGDQVALHALFERTHRLLFTSIVNTVASREIAERLTLEVFHDLWRRAYRYDPRHGPVLGWLMNQARSRVLACLLYPRKKHAAAEFGDESRASPQERLAHRIATDTGEPLVLPGKHDWSEPQWEDVAPGISCQVLAFDRDRHVVSMLVRLAPGGEYPPHTHAGVEELHLLDGELWIDDLKLYPGDYNRADAGTADRRVWSETGCTCVLITSTKDVLT
ncbi:MAG TPA: cupin domain-containing protein [Burkholderiales bacterium]|jgi:DNA-directed RNA polymerase specialized sigma24 family protein